MLLTNDFIITNKDFEVAYGHNCDVIFSYVYNWCMTNKKQYNNFRDGFFWTYNTCKAISKEVRVLSEYQVEKAILKLEKLGIIKSGQYNFNKYDHKKWYTVTEKGMKIYQSFCSVKLDVPFIKEEIFEETEVKVEEEIKEEKSQLAENSNTNEQNCRVESDNFSSSNTIYNTINNTIYTLAEQKNCSEQQVAENSGKEKSEKEVEKTETNSSLLPTQELNNSKQISIKQNVTKTIKTQCSAAAPACKSAEWSTETVENRDEEPVTKCEFIGTETCLSCNKRDNCSFLTEEENKGLEEVFNRMWENSVA